MTPVATRGRAVWFKVIRSNKILKSEQKKNSEVTAKSSSFFEESGWNKLELVQVSSGFHYNSENMGLDAKYTGYKILIEAVSSPFIEAITASIALVLHMSSCLGHMYMTNSKESKNLQPLLFFTRLWSSTALLTFEICEINMNISILLPTIQ